MKFDFTNLKVLLIGDFMIDQYIFEAQTVCHLKHCTSNDYK